MGFSILLRPLLLPLTKPLRHSLAPAAVPRVAIAPLGLDLGDVVLLHAVAAGKDRAIRFDLVILQ